MRPSVLPSANCTASAPRFYAFAAQWLAYALPYRRFTCALTGAGARLGADAVRYSFIAADFHRLLPAGIPALTQFSFLKSIPWGRLRLSREVAGGGAFWHCRSAVGRTVKLQTRDRTVRSL